MKPVQQTVFKKTLGDCFRACVASIFEFPIEEMPNFWEQTQDGEKFWELTNKWMLNLGYKCVSFQIKKQDQCEFNRILCVACAKSPRGDEDHAVVWRDGLVYDPHPSQAGLTEYPDTFTFFIPLDPGMLKK